MAQNGAMPLRTYLESDPARGDSYWCVRCGTTSGYLVYDGARRADDLGIPIIIDGIAMSEHERIDIFDERMQQIGSTTRAEAHRKGCWHQTIHCWLICRGMGDGYVLFQRRNPGCELFPNFLDITASGHLLAGESALDGTREVREELDIDVDGTQLIPLGIRLETTAVDQIINREFAHVFLLETTRPAHEFELRAGEVTGVYQMTIADGLRLFSGEAQCAPASGVERDAAGLKRSVTIDVAMTDVVPRVDRYYLKVFIMAERYFHGLVELAI
jgi:isopentenyldiphosphate isomerase